jgi:hypothetical protein
MPNLRVKIVRFVDEEPQPGIVESQFRDDEGQVHSIIDKVPYFINAVLWSDSEYPQPGDIRCRVLERIHRISGDFARITIAEPDYIEATDGKSEFVVNEADLFD